MNHAEAVPTPSELAHAPELALIAVLESTLELTVCILVAEHPQLYDHERPYWIVQPPASILAESIVSLVDSLRQALADYRFQIHLDMNTPTPDDGESQF